MSQRRAQFFTRHGIIGFLFGIAFATSIVMLAQVGAIYALSFVSSIDAGSLVREHWPIILGFSAAASIVMILRNRFFEGD
jgi:hypothetical protein